MQRLILALFLMTALAPDADAFSAMSQTQAQSCAGIESQSDGGVDLAISGAFSESSGECDDLTQSSATASSDASIQAAGVSVSGLSTGAQEMVGAFAQASFGDRLTVENVPAGVDSIDMRVTISLQATAPAAAFYNSASFDASVNAQVAPGQVRLFGCSGDLCFGEFVPLETQALTETVTLNRNGLGEFGFIDVFMDARFNTASTNVGIVGTVSIEITNEPNATVLSESGLFPSGSADSDGDGIADSADNCIDVANNDQRDTNGDGYGNVCDADLNDDCVVNVLDLGILRAVFFSNDADADFNGDSVVNVSDLGTMRLNFFAAPGPSGVSDVCS